MREITLNKMPAPTWNRLGLNDITVRLPELSHGADITAQLPGGVQLHRFDRICANIGITALGEEAASPSEGGVRLSGSSEKAALLDIASAGGSENVILHADSGERLNVIMYVTSGGSLRTFAEVSGNAHIRLVQIFEGGKDTLMLNDTAASVGASAGFELTQIFLGGARTVTGVCTELNGYRSEFDCKLGYILGSDELLDINNVVLHKGRRSRSATGVKGVLSGNAEKVFRGTIDFRNGASGSVGSETEDVLLLNESVINKTVPVILCSEEDVEGSHGASIGRLSDDILYYMGSRGIPAETACRLIASSRLEGMINGTGDERTAERALRALSERSSYAVF